MATRSWIHGVVLAVVAALALGFADAATAAVNGTLFEQHGETLQGTTVDRAFFIATARGAVRLSQAQPEGLVGQPVTVTDTDALKPGLQGQVRAVHPDERLQPAPAPGPQTVLALILTTPDDPTPVTFEPESVRRQIFTDPQSTGAYYAQQSNGATVLTGRVNPAGDVLGPITLSTAIAGCPTEAIANEADQSAAALGYAPGAYDHVIYILPHSGECNFGGLGQLPGHRSWSNGYLLTTVLAHELGHNMGAHHANLLSCTDSRGAPTPYSSTCNSNEYGDPFDVMGSSSALMSAFHRDQIGELAESEALRLQQSGTTPVASSEDFLAEGPRLVLVPIKHPHVAVSEYFAIDARTPLAPFDSWTAGEPVTTGLTIRKVTDLTNPILQTQLINMHPTEPVRDSALQVGETFSDPADGITITAGSGALGVLQADISMPTLTDDVPPSAPPWLSVSLNSSGAHLTWTSGRDNVAVDHYRLLRNGTELGTTTALMFDDPNIPPSTLVTYSVITVDTSGNESSPVALTVTFARPVAQASGTGVLDSSTSNLHKIRVAKGLGRDRHGRLLVTIHCETDHGECSGIVWLRTRGNGGLARLGSAPYHVRSGVTAKIAIVVVKRLASLARSRALRVHVLATVHGGATVTQTCRLPAAAPPWHRTTARKPN